MGHLSAVEKNMRSITDRPVKPGAEGNGGRLQGGFVELRINAYISLDEI